MKKPLLILFLLLFSLASSTFALELNIQPTIPDRLTFGQLSQYDISGSGGGGILFLLSLNNPEQQDYQNLQITFSIAYASSGQSGNFVKIQEGKTDPFDLSAKDGMITMTSTEFFTENNPAVKFSNNGKGSSLNEDYRDKLIMRSIESGSLIPGRILFDFELIDENGRRLASSRTEHEILITSVLQPVSPGAALADNGSLPVYTPYPTFLWTSDLFNHIYEGFAEPVVFRLSLYESIDELPASAALTQPIFTTETEVNYYSYTPQDRPLTPGKKYYWKLEGFLRGVAVAVMKSEIYQFEYIEPTEEINPKIQSIMAMLQMLLNYPPYNAYVETLRPYFSSLIAKMDKGEVDLDRVVKELQKLIAREVRLENIQLQ